jgi:hypothetical protein
MPETVCALGTEQSSDFVNEALSRSEEGRALFSSLQDQGLEPMVERAQMFTAYGPETRRAIAIAVVPFVSKELDRHGGLSISQGGYAKAVIVETPNKTAIRRFHTYDFTDRVVVEDYDVGQLEQGPEALFERVDRRPMPVNRERAELTVSQVRSISDMAFLALLEDESSTTVHSREEIIELRGNLRIARDISTFVALRAQSSPGTGCCCTCSCWGCSSCCCCIL